MRRIPLSMLTPDEIEGLPYINPSGVIAYARPAWWGEDITVEDYEAASNAAKLALGRIIDVYPGKIEVKKRR